MRLGEYDTETNPDCVQFEEDKDCNDTPFDSAPQRKCTLVKDPWQPIAITFCSLHSRHNNSSEANRNVQRIWYCCNNNVSNAAIYRWTQCCASHFKGVEWVTHNVKLTVQIYRIALTRFACSRPLDFIRPICLPAVKHHNFFSPEEILFVTGWGYTVNGCKGILMLL